MRPFEVGDVIRVSSDIAKTSIARWMFAGKTGTVIDSTGCENTVRCEFEDEKTMCFYPSELVHWGTLDVVLELVP